MPKLKKAKLRNKQIEKKPRKLNELSKFQGPGKEKKTWTKYPGAHVSAAADPLIQSKVSHRISGGVENAVKNALEETAGSFGFFLKSQRQWKGKAYTEDNINLFKEALKKANYPLNLILPHGCYLVNLGSPNEETWKKSREAFLDELQRCEQLGLLMLNIHPGSTCGKISREECMDKIAESINEAHKQTKFVKVVLENMSKQGNTIGGEFEELKYIIDRVEDKSRIGVCIDTCHAMAAGYDLSTFEGFEQMKQDLENIIGVEYLCGLHLNDSKGEAGCHLDRHENIGKGKIGREGFSRIMTDPMFDDLPMILETPYKDDKGYKFEIDLLRQLMKN